MFTGLRALLILVLITTAFAAALATGADARSRHRHGRGGDGFDVGDAIIGAAVLGAVIGIVNAGKKDRDMPEGRPLPPAPYPDDAYPGDAYPAASNEPYDARNDPDLADWAFADPGFASRFPSERRAIDACAREAESLGGRYGADARLSRIDEVGYDGGEMRVTGTVRIDNRREGRIDSPGFTCFAEDGSVTGFRFAEQLATR
ncbi:hypothetical protein ACSMXM_08465 [Pacificimonas sp. ICDLI1SI03]